MWVVWRAFDRRALGPLPGFWIPENRSLRDCGAGAAAGLLITRGNCPGASLTDGSQVFRTEPPIAGSLHPHGVQSLPTALWVTLSVKETELKIH